MNNVQQKKRLLLFGSPRFGIGDYIAHLYPHLVQFFDVRIASYSHLALDDEVKPDPNELFFQNVKNYQLLARLTKDQYHEASYEKFIKYIDEVKPEIFNIQVSGIIKKDNHFFYKIIEYLKKKNVYIQFTLHDVEVFDPSDNINKQDMVNFVDLADMIFVGNEREKKLFGQYFQNNKPVEITYHGIYDLFDRKKYNKTQARKILNINEHDFVALFFGAYRENKGLVDLINATSYIDKVNPESKLLIYVAAGTRRDHSIIDYSHNLAKKLNISNRIIFNFKKIIPFTLDEIEMYFKAANISVMPYIKISQSGILALSVGYRKPVIITDKFGETFDIKNKLGLVTPSKQPQELANALLTLEKDYDKFVQSFSQSIKTYGKKYSWQKIASTMYKFSAKS